MLHKTQVTLLEELAKTYAYYTQSTPDWVKKRLTLDGGVGGMLLDSCHQPEHMKVILNVLNLGLKEMLPAATTVCAMFDELLKKDEAIQQSVNKAYSKSMACILQQKPLKDGLGETLQTFHEAQKIFDSVIELAPKIVEKETQEKQSSKFFSPF
ncbi:MULTISPECIES: hypothetical protein [Legionella]|uniref:Uncharacterized protein n=1 Tax=Legionella septentrionalis TaxID=2498109 RepID=A0A433JH21_9GAMM|nr:MULTISPECIES: hypothetical protein [Legionella]MCP0914685.1 hypothetical protein [Legionella sp. 27cVA30]RUQ81599.1 hypothetical protein EKM59_10020 [Legionella septentrionalis]RUQ95755.1 hypothetical protein ELY11_08750 [Legionella septentrionalis]RUR09131.1 hypothetical protein ELY14_09545 [Legionella septentrionalis]RUR15638.1 hypothetical protein ELY10_05455 [Legionella septentrionalis]